MSALPRLPLSLIQAKLRLWAITAILSFMALAWTIHPTPGSPGSWGICGFQNMVGLPCPLCGGTRATHYLLHGDLGATLYYNWLAIPAVLLGLALIGVMAFEIARRRVYLPSPRRPSKTLIALASVCALAIWIFHVYDTLKTPKPELLNSGGLYFKWKPENNPRSTSR